MILRDELVRETRRRLSSGSGVPNRLRTGRQLFLDFLLNGSTAVEFGDQLDPPGVGLEHELYPLRSTFADVLNSLGSAQSISW